VAEQTAAADHRPERPLLGVETEPVVGGLASKWRKTGCDVDDEINLATLSGEGRFEAMASASVQDNPI
jgi:hypothetical protein